MTSLPELVHHAHGHLAAEAVTQQCVGVYLQVVQHRQHVLRRGIRSGGYMWSNLCDNTILSGFVCCEVAIATSKRETCTCVCDNHVE